MTTWHDDANTRKSIGDEVESLFESTVTCACGGRFRFVGHLRPGFPDFTCETCGQLVDVKASPQAERTGNISVSAIPWQNYPDEMILVTRIGGEWIGEYKHLIQVENHAAFQPTHARRHQELGNTRWHLISWRNFRRIKELGLIEQA